MTATQTPDQTPPLAAHAETVPFGPAIDKLCAFLLEWAERRRDNTIALLLVMAVHGWLLRWKLRLLAAASRGPSAGARPRLDTAAAGAGTAGGLSSPRLWPPLPRALARAIGGLARIGGAGDRAETLLAEPDMQSLLAQAPELGAILEGPAAEPPPPPHWLLPGGEPAAIEPRPPSRLQPGEPAAIAPPPRAASPYAAPARPRRIVPAPPPEHAPRAHRRPPRVVEARAFFSARGAVHISASN